MLAWWKLSFRKSVDLFVKYWEFSQSLSNLLARISPLDNRPFDHGQEKCLLRGYCASLASCRADVVSIAVLAWSIVRWYFGHGLCFFIMNCVWRSIIFGISGYDVPTFRAQVCGRTFVTLFITLFYPLRVAWYDEQIGSTFKSFIKNSLKRHWQFP